MKKKIYYIRFNNECFEDMLSNGYETNFQRLMKKLKAYRKKNPKDKIDVLEYTLEYTFKDIMNATRNTDK